MKSFTDIIAAGGSAMHVWPGKVLSVKSSTLPLTICFDGQDSDAACKAGRVFDYSPGGFTTVNLTNPNAVAVTITFYIGDAAVTYAPDDNANSNAQMIPLGNMGVAIGAAAAGGLPACDSTGFLLVTNAMALALPGVDSAGRRRQSVVFSMASNSPASLNILDATGCAYMTLAAGDKIERVTDANFTLSGAGGTAWVTIGQDFLASK